MYPWELDEFIKKNNRYLGGENLLKAISKEENPQLKEIRYCTEENKYELWDVEGNYYTFKAMPYEEAIEKNMVRVRKKE